ncbi:ribosome maturation protein sbds-like protein [Chrysochromulina tobinii]|uniref:Ribosome maturation protein sbds-like protein n=1 Tax=Chrysochromulina tobinii TaxID=1460289 RepID=A0A0M0J3L2_9EUKA|nr:ribosome maturation protein sbds-like protein [Chrysochromulina tobinii]|eukprot:KOO21151.1 ribosome maturation protein sbds-like protein [Chrysochromulina sp. CCMP291]
MPRLQPVGIKKLTNICIVRLKRNGKRFEVAAYRNTVVAWRNKVEKNIDEVLQVHTIFENVEKGILAKSEDMLDAFGTDDEDKVCVEVLDRGEFQMSEEERQMMVDALFRDVASRVTDMCVNPETRLPYPLSTIERAMRETLHFAPATNKSAKMQALQVIRQLEVANVVPIARARMQLRLLVPTEELAKMQTALQALAEAEAAGGASERLQLNTPEPAADAAAVPMSAIGCHSDPSLFRPLSELARAHGGSAPATLPAAAPVAASSDSSGSGPATAKPASSGPSACGAGGGGDRPKPPSREERMFKLNLRNAEKGDPVAQLEVGKAFLDGMGVEADVQQGKDWLRQAAQQGVDAAKIRLAELGILTYR